MLQRADYTHKFNKGAGRHGWLRLTPAYSVKIVDELIGRSGPGGRVLDPFCGTATTALCAAYRGHECVTVDINPFLVWLGRAKTASYSKDSADAARAACGRIVAEAERGGGAAATPPPIHNIGRWWGKAELDSLCKLKACVERECGADPGARDILMVAFCKTMIGVSNAAFNHQSMSFKERHGRGRAADVGGTFGIDVESVIAGMGGNPKGKAAVLAGDSRRLEAVVDGSFDAVVTSPPYANRMSYIRELRPYMYWLGFLNDGREAGDLDWSAIGGTWGVATSRLAGWKPPEGAFTHPRLDAALEGMSNPSNRSGDILSNYVARYFDDMWTHFNSLVRVLNGGAEVHYIVGNSTFYGTLLPVEGLYAEMLRRLGFRDVRCRPIRKRNSKKELFEFDVSGRWGGG